MNVVTYTLRAFQGKLHFYWFARTFASSFTLSFSRNPNCAHKIRNNYPINLLANHWIWWIFEIHLWKQVINGNSNAHMRIISAHYVYTYRQMIRLFFCREKTTNVSISNAWFFETVMPAIIRSFFRKRNYLLSEIPEKLERNYRLSNWVTFMQKIKNTLNLWKVGINRDIFLSIRIWLLTKREIVTKLFNFNEFFSFFLWLIPLKPLKTVLKSQTKSKLAINCYSYRSFENHGRAFKIAFLKITHPHSDGLNVAKIKLLRRQK